MARREVVGLRWRSIVSLLGRWWGTVQLQSQDKLGLAHPDQSFELSQLRLDRDLIATNTIDRIRDATANCGRLQHQPAISVGRSPGRTIDFLGAIRSDHFP